MVLIKSVVYVNNLKPIITNTKYTVFRDTLYILYKQPILFESHPKSLQPGKLSSCLSTLISFFDKGFFSLLLLVVLISILFFLFRLNLIFVSFGYIFLVLLQDDEISIVAKNMSSHCTCHIFL